MAAKKQIHRKIEGGIIVGNFYDKYESSNPIEKVLVKNFYNNLKQLIGMSKAQNIHEIGCGEGHLSFKLAGAGYNIRSCDISKNLIDQAQNYALSHNLNIRFKVRNIYDLLPENDAEEMIMCCEVLEHIENPLKALEILSCLAKPYLLISVPREPLWSTLNILRFKYLSTWGNTPGHIQKWTRKQFIELLRNFFDIIHISLPLPWIMVLCKVKSSQSK